MLMVGAGGLLGGKAGHGVLGAIGGAVVANMLGGDKLVSIRTPATAIASILTSIFRKKVIMRRETIATRITRYGGRT